MSAIGFLSRQKPLTLPEWVVLIEKFRERLKHILEFFTLPRLRETVFDNADDSKIRLADVPITYVGEDRKKHPKDLGELQGVFKCGFYNNMTLEPRPFWGLVRESNEWTRGVLIVKDSGRWVYPHPFPWAEKMTFSPATIWDVLEIDTPGNVLRGLRNAVIAIEEHTSIRFEQITKFRQELNRLVLPALDIPDKPKKGKLVSVKIRREDARLTLLGAIESIEPAPDGQLIVKHLVRDDQGVCPKCGICASIGEQATCGFCNIRLKLP